MANPRTVLRQVSAHIEESLGVRTMETHPRLSPVAGEQDVGRVPLRKFGKLEVDRIVPDPRQPRTEFDEEEIRWLARSLRNTGQLHPIRVRWDKDLKQWIIITGERRWRATVAAGLKEIDCYFHEGELTASEILEQQLVENLLRKNLSPLEEARGYQSLMDVNHWTGKQVAESLRISPSKVSRALALLDLPKEVQQRIEAGDIRRTSAYELTKLTNAQTQERLAEQTSGSKRTHRQTARAVKQRRGTAGRRSSKVRLEFPTESGWTLVAVHNDRRQTNYDELSEALEEVKTEVELRVNNRIQLL